MPGPAEGPRFVLWSQLGTAGDAGDQTSPCGVPPWQEGACKPGIL